MPPVPVSPNPFARPIRPSWRLFCPRAGCHYARLTDDDERTVRVCLQHPCPDCQAYGLDALEIRP